MNIAMLTDEELSVELLRTVTKVHDSSLSAATRVLALLRRDQIKYERRVRELEREGCTRSDAQGIADVEEAA